MNELLHFSAKPLYDVKSVEQESEPAYKPSGLWVSVGEAWAEWCAGESYALESFKHATRVQLVKGARVLRCTDAADLDAFTQQYGHTPEWSRDKSYHVIDWRKVAADFDGIIIAPYVYKRRYSLSWYYPWDCASGCIWNARAVASLNSMQFAGLAVATSEDHGP